MSAIPSDAAWSGSKIVVKIRDSKALDLDSRWDVKLTRQDGEIETKSLGEWRKLLENGKDKFLWGRVLEEVGRREDARKRAEASVSKPERLESGSTIPAYNHKDDDRKTLADIVIDAALVNGIEPFMDQYGEAYAAIEVKGHREITRMRSSRFSLWLQYLYYQETKGRSLNKEALGQAIATFEAKAVFEGETRPLFLRTAWNEGELYYDLCDDSWRAVRISPSIKPWGWEIIERPPILFKREKHMKAQVEPVPGGSWVDWWTNILNISHSDWPLAKSHVVQLFIPGHPVSFLNLHNRKGASKTWTVKAIREIVDPSVSPTQELTNPKTNLNDLFEQNYLPLFDNADDEEIKGFIFNKLCRVNTGEASQERELYKNKEQVLYQYQRSSIFTSISPIGMEHPDFVQRTVYLELPYIPEDDRDAEKRLGEKIDRMKPEVLGFIFTTLSKAMGLKDGVKLEKLPRMADYAEWGEAISRALGEAEGTFIEAYQKDIRTGVEETLNANPLGQAIVELFGEAGTQHLIGPPEEVYQRLSEIAENKKIDTKSRLWPRASNALSRKMPEIVDDLKSLDIYYAKDSNCSLSDEAVKEGGTGKYAANRQIILLIKKDAPFLEKLSGSKGNFHDILTIFEKYREKSQLPKIDDFHDITIFSTPLEGEAKSEQEGPAPDPEPDQKETVEGLKKLLATGKIGKKELDRLDERQRTFIEKLIEKGKIGTNPSTGAYYWRG